jgi:hypothetical protein
MSWKQLDALIENTQSDYRKMELYRILSRQVEQLIHKGSPDLHTFYNNLESEKLISSWQVNQWRKKYNLDSVSGISLLIDLLLIKSGPLDAAVNQIVHLISSKILNKNTPDKKNTVSVNRSTELFYDIFKQLRPGR